MWNKQRTDEVLVDVDDVALGHKAVMRWNRPAQWVASKDLAHEPLIDPAAFDQVQATFSNRARTSTAHQAHRSRHPYVFKSLVFCGTCGRKMQGLHAHGIVYYRCRYPREYALANTINHPLNVLLREDVLIAPLDTWLLQEFSPAQRRHTVAKLVDQAQIAAPTPAPVVPTGPTIADCDAKLAKYRAALEAGADPAVVATWIAETQQDRLVAEQHHQQVPAAPDAADNVLRLSAEEIITIVDECGDLVTALRDAAPEQKLDVYRNLGLRLTYDPEKRTVRARVDLAAHRWDLVRVRSPT